jgi:predicted kinase
VIILQPGSRDDHAGEARHLFDAAGAFLAPSSLDLIAIGGFSGTGKSSLAAALADSLGRAPGAVHLRSDIERKRICGVKEHDRLSRDAYRTETTARVYQRLRDLASLALDAGQSTIVDAVHLRPEARRAVKHIAARSNAHFTGIWLEAPLNTLVKRVGNRELDASDATVEVVAAQAKQTPGAIDWLRLDASAPVEDLAARALRSILS